MKLIDKVAVLAEIDKVMAEEMKFYETACKEGDEEVSSSPMVYTRLQILRSYIDTLEVKEVDLEKHLKEDIEDVLFDLNGVAVKGATHYLTVEDVKDIAKHFFELGFMHTLSWKDIRLIAEIGEEFMCSEESDAYTDEESYYNAILNKLKEKGLDYKTQRQEIRDIKALKGEEA